MKMLIIGITGGTGCGKTTVVNQIIKELSGEEVTVISQDSYYKDLSHLSFEERTKNNFDHPNSIDFELLKEHYQKTASISQKQLIWRDKDGGLLIARDIRILFSLLLKDTIMHYSFDNINGYSITSVVRDNNIGKLFSRFYKL